MYEYFNHPLMTVCVAILNYMFNAQLLLFISIEAFELFKVVLNIYFFKLEP